MGTRLKFRINKETASKIIDGAVVTATVAARVTEVGTAVIESRRQGRIDRISRNIEIGKASAEILGEFNKALKR